MDGSLGLEGSKGDGRVASLAWMEPRTAAVCLYLSCSALRGVVGLRLVRMRLRSFGDWGLDLATEEFGDLVCDHPEILLVAAFLAAVKPKFQLNFKHGIGRCDPHGCFKQGSFKRIKTGCFKTGCFKTGCFESDPRPLRTLRLLRCAPVERGQAQALQDQEQAGGVCREVLQADGGGVSSSGEAQRRGSAAPVHPLRQLAKAVRPRAAQAVRRRKALPFGRPLCDFHAGARQGHGARSEVHAEAGACFGDRGVRQAAAGADASAGAGDGGGDCWENRERSENTDYG